MLLVLCLVICMLLESGLQLSCWCSAGVICGWLLCSADGGAVWPTGGMLLCCYCSAGGWLLCSADGGAVCLCQQICLAGEWAIYCCWAALNLNSVAAAVSFWDFSPWMCSGGLI
ncbi:hypothetical protein LOK49_Contig200G00004 [Camellia lanceoleosa]|nr:hypothetical protein LOK49_Contig200G00004 [Camellia lanceoleosa]